MGWRIKVMKRYGPVCAVCDFDVVELLDAAHIVARADNGVDDPRNGLVLCSLHHRAYDRGFYAIHPKSKKIFQSLKGPNLECAASAQNGKMASML